MLEPLFAIAGILIALRAAVAIANRSPRSRSRSNPRPLIPQPPPPPAKFHYVTKLGDRFTFDIRPEADGYRAYILDQPSYGKRSRDLHATHRIPAGGGRHYVCIAPEHTPDNPQHARDWAAYWAENTSRYLRDGKPFA